MRIRIEFLFHHFSNQARVSWHPLLIHTASVSVGSQELRTKAKENCCHGTTFKHRDEPKNEFQDHYPVQLCANMRSLPLASAVLRIRPENGVSPH